MQIALLYSRIATLLLQDHVCKTSICISFIPLSKSADHTSSFPAAKLTFDNAHQWWLLPELQLHLSMHTGMNLPLSPSLEKYSLPDHVLFIHHGWFNLNTFIHSIMLTILLSVLIIGTTSSGFHQHCICTYLCINFGPCNCNSLPSLIPLVYLSHNSRIFPMM